MSDYQNQESLNGKIEDVEKVSLEDRSSGRRPRLASFTLIELMIVVAVIGLIAGIVLAAAGGVQKKAARDQTTAEIKTLCTALERYRADNGSYPSTSGQASRTAVYSSLTNYMAFQTNRISGSGTSAQYLDPYGQPYWYQSPSTRTTGSLMSGGQDSFDVWSVGADGKKDTKDDLRSWE